MRYRCCVVLTTLLTAFIFCAVGVQAGNWDEHLVLQTFINDLAVGSNVWWLDNGVTTFVLGVAQHETYDLTVNERPINLTRVLRQWQNRGDGVNYLKEEIPSALLNVTGMGVAIYRTIRLTAGADGGADGVQKHVLGLLGAIAPDILDGARLGLMGPEKAAIAWNRGNSSTFHIKPPEEWKYPVDTFGDNRADIWRRVLLQCVGVIL